MKTLQVLIALFALAFLPLHAASLDDLTYTTTDGEVTITDCDTTATGELVIPNIIGGNPVTSIANFTFSQCGNLESITIPDSVNSIGTFAFFNCTSLTSITIPEGVTSIQNSVFASCSSLPSITIPDSVTSIGNFTFYNCASLTSITLPVNLTSIGEEAFDECANLGAVIFQGPAPTVGNGAFAGLPTSANALVKAGNLSSFGAKFSNWNGLTVNTILTWTTNSGEVTITDCYTVATGELVIPNTIDGNTVTSIGYLAFLECTGLTSITIPDSVTSIDDYAFRSCSSLTSITIPNSVTSIGDYAFYNCTSLTGITIPNSVTSIGEGAFRSCTSLTSITFQGAAPTVGVNAFFNTPDGAVALVTSANLDFFGENGSSWNRLLLIAPSQLVAQLAQMTAERDAVIAERDSAITERDARPTQAAYDTAVVTARIAGQADVTGDPASYSLFTEDQINGMTTDPTIGRNAAGNMQVDISFIHSTDLQTFTPFAVNPAWVSVVDGKIALEFPPSNENTFFYRLGVQ